MFVPKGSQLLEGLGSEVDITTNEEFDKTYFDGFFTLRPQSKSKIILTYTIPYKPDEGQPYRLLIQKQPGVKVIKELVNIKGKTDEFDDLKDIERSYQL